MSTKYPFVRLDYRSLVSVPVLIDGLGKTDSQECIRFVSQIILYTSMGIKTLTGIQILSIIFLSAIYLSLCCSP